MMTFLNILLLVVVFRYIYMYATGNTRERFINNMFKDDDKSFEDMKKKAEKDFGQENNKTLEDLDNQIKFTIAMRNQLDEDTKSTNEENDKVEKEILDENNRQISYKAIMDNYRLMGDSLIKKIEQ
jgi:hypothetical protein